MNQPFLLNQNRKFYLSLLISIFFFIASTMLVSSTVLYYNFENIALGQVYRSDLNSLNQTRREVDDITTIAKSLTSQIYSDLTISKLLYFSDTNVFDESAAMMQLRNYTLSMPFIESVYVYNNHMGTFYISSNLQRNGRQEINELDDRGIMDILNNYKEHLPYVPIPRTYTIGDNQMKVSSYTYLAYDLSNGEKLDNAVIVNISESWLNKNISGTNQSGYTLIIDNNGKLLSGNINESLSQLPYIRKLLDPSASSGFFVENVNGIKSLVSYTAPNELDWRFVRVMPYKNITSKITEMRINTVIVSLSILILGMVLSLVISRKLYRPINKIIMKMSSMEAEQRDHKHVLKQEFLRNMILGRETVQYPALQEKLKYYAVSIDIRKSFRLVLLRIDNYEGFCEKNNTDEQRLMKFAVQNIAAEICKTDVDMESVDMGEDSILLLIGMEAEREEGHNPFESASFSTRLTRLQSALADYLKLSVSIAVSPVGTGAGQLKTLYKQVYEASFHRLFQETGCRLYAEPIMDLKRKVYTYPIAKEKQLIEFVMTGKVEESKRLLSDILDETANFPYTVVQLALSHLSLTMSNMIHAIQLNNAFVVEADLDTSIVSLQNIERLEEVKVQFYRLFEQVGRKLEAKRKVKHDALIQMINDWIARDYANPDLSLNVIADKLGMTPAYISRLFKQFTLNSLTDVINDVRLRNAKELLIQTDIPVTQIAIKTGFTTLSYFFRMFKRTCSVTPNDYRKLHRSDMRDKRN